MAFTLSDREQQLLAQRAARRQQEAATKTANSQLAEKAAQYKNVNQTDSNPFTAFLNDTVGALGRTLGNIAGAGGTAIQKAITGEMGLEKELDDLYSKGFETGDYSELANKLNNLNALERGALSNISTAKLKGWNDVTDKAATEQLMQNVGDAGKSAATLLQVTPGGGAVARAGLNVAGGALQGAGEEFTSKGKDATLEGALARAATGAAAEGATLGALKGIGKVAGKVSDGVVGKAANAIANPNTILSQAARSATEGAIGGGISAAGNTLAEGASLEEALGQLGSGALGGALAGGTLGGASAIASKALGAVGDRISNRRSQKSAPALADTASDASSRRTTATGWGDKDMADSAQKRGTLQKIGDTLQETGQQTKDSSVYGKLKGNTAEEMQRKGAIEKLRKDYGYSPSDYQQAANASEVINKWYDNEVKASGATKVAPDLQDQLLKIADERNLNDKALATYKKNIGRLLDGSLVNDDGTMNKYGAYGLEQSAQQLGDYSKKLTTTSSGGSKAANGTLSPDDASLAYAYDDARKLLRKEVSEMVELDDITKNNLSKVLDDAGVPTKTKNKIMNSSTLADVKRNTSTLEDARTMYNQMQSSSLKRGANADNSTNIVTQAASAAGIAPLLNTALRPVGTIVGSIEQGVGKAISNASNLAGRIDTSAQIPTWLDAMMRQTTAANQGSNAVNNMREQENREIDQDIASVLSNYASQGYDINDLVMPRQISDQSAANILGQVSTTPLSEATGLGGYTTSVGNTQTNPFTTQLDSIAGAMQNALSAGDITAYAELADLYSTIAGLVPETTSTTPQLNATQQKTVIGLQNAYDSLQSLERLFSEAGGGQGGIGGTLATVSGGLSNLFGGSDPVATYNSQATALINTLKDAIGKTDAANTDPEVQRLMAMIPNVTDSPQDAQNKLNNLRNYIETTYQNTMGTYGGNYSLY